MDTLGWEKLHFGLGDKLLIFRIFTFSSISLASLMISSRKDLKVRRKIFLFSNIWKKEIVSQNGLREERGISCSEGQQDPRCRDQRKTECPFSEVSENSIHVLIFRTMSASYLCMFILLFLCVYWGRGKGDLIVHLQLTRYYFEVLNT